MICKHGFSFDDEYNNSKHNSICYFEHKEMISWKIWTSIENDFLGYKVVQAFVKYEKIKFCSFELTIQ